MDNQVKKFDIKKVGGFLLNNAVVIMIIISAIAVGISNPNFFGMYNIKNLLMNVSVRVVIAFGIAARVSQNAVDTARAKGIRVGMVRPISLWPFPEKALKAAAAQCRSFIFAKTLLPLWIFLID